MLEAIRPTAEEMSSLNDLVEPGPRLDLPIYCYEPAPPPALKRSKNKLGYNGFSDKQQMFMMLERWVASEKEDALQIVEDTFDGGDTPPQRIWLSRVNFLAYAKELGDFLAKVTFLVEYLYIKEDYSAEAQGEHDIDLWITLDSPRRNVAGVVVDDLNTLDTCNGYRLSK